MLCHRRRWATYAWPAGVTYHLPRGFRLALKRASTPSFSSVLITNPDTVPLTHLSGWLTNYNSASTFALGSHSISCHSIQFTHRILVQSLVPSLCQLPTLLSHSTRRSHPAQPPPWTIASPLHPTSNFKTDRTASRPFVVPTCLAETVSP